MIISYICYNSSKKECNILYNQFSEMVYFYGTFQTVNFFKIKYITNLKLAARSISAYTNNYQFKYLYSLNDLDHNIEKSNINYHTKSKITNL